MTDALQAGNMVLATGYLFGGAALNYFGFRLHQLAIFAVGAVWGILLGAGGSAALDGGHINILATIVLAVVMGFVALAAQFLAIFLIGAFVGGVAAVAMGLFDPAALLIAGLFGGAIALGLYKTAIVFGTAFAGSILMTFAVLTFIAISNGEAGLSLPNLFSYITNFVVSVVKSGDPAVAKTLATTHVMIFAVIFISGVAVQFGLMQRAAANADEKPTHQPPRSPFDVRTPSSPDARIERANASEIEIERRMRGAPASPFSKMQSQPSRGDSDRNLLVFINGKEIERCHLRSQSTLRLGRNTDMDIVVPNDQVSGHHLDVIVDNDTLKLVDCGSTNGVWKKGTTKVTTDRPETGDWYRIGDVVHLKFS